LDTENVIVYLQATATQYGFSGGGRIGAVTPGAKPTYVAGSYSSQGAQTAQNLRVDMNGQQLTGTATLANGTANAFSALNGNVTLDNATGTGPDIWTALQTSIGQILDDRAAGVAGAGITGQGRIIFSAAAYPAFDPSAVVAGSPVAGIINQSDEQITSNTGIVDQSKYSYLVASAGTAAINTDGVHSNFGAWALASAINHNSASQFWAMVQPVNSGGESADMVYIFNKEGGNFNNLLACEVSFTNAGSLACLEAIAFENTQTSQRHEDGTNFTLGGEKWGTMTPTQTKANLGNEVWNVTLNGRDVGAERDLWIANGGEIATPGLTDGIINGMDRHNFVEIQNAANGPWRGAEVRTQSSAQEALDAITEAINTKDKIRADLGAMQNRLENTMTNLTVQAENLQASESRISDVDVATEMTEFTRNNVLAQAATSMLAQANSLSQLALSLIR
jgi:flagellin-like hook-associated protein FlgL